MGNARIPDVNELFLAGRLTRDPELKQLSSGTQLAKFGFVHSRKFKGEEHPMFIDVTVWGQSAEYVAQNLTKGDKVMLRGRLEQETWDDKQTGAKRSKHTMTAHNVNALEWPDDGQQAAPKKEYDGGYVAPPKEQPIPEDDIPF